MLTPRTDALLERVRRADPAATLDQNDAQARLILDRVLTAPDEPRRRRRPAAFHTALLVALAAAALLVPAAVAFHKQILEAIQADDRTAAISDLEGTWAARVEGGRWTITVMVDRNILGDHGGYALRHNGRLVAAGALSLTYSSEGGVIGVHDTGGPGQCTEERVGTYRFRLARGAITLEPFRDLCRKRRAVLAAQPFERTRGPLSPV
jgi:hypothetical protein